MKNRKESTDYFIYGTFNNPGADILKKELENNGIPVKVLYPGTNIGRESTEGAIFSAYDLMIRICDYERAEEIRKKFGINHVKKGELMDLPNDWNNFGKIILVGTICFLIISIILDQLKEKLSSIRINYINDYDLVFVILLSLSLLFIISFAIYYTIKRLFRRK